MPLGTAATTLGEAVLDGRPVFRAVLVQEIPTGVMVDTLDTDPATLRPIRYRNALGDRQSIQVDYGADGHVRSQVTRAGHTTVLDTTVTTEVYDAGSFLSIPPALPLVEGFAAEIPVFHYATGVSSIGVRVVGTGTVDYRGEERPAWAVEYESAPGLVATLSIDRETRRILRFEGAFSDGRKFVQVMR